MKFINYITESSKDDYTGIFIGRFQGLTIGHTKVIDIMNNTHQQNYVVLVKGAKSSEDKERNPFPFSVQQKMLKRVMGLNTELVVSPSADLEDLLPKIDGKKFVIYAGPDRLQDYRKYANYLKKQGFSVKVVDTGQMLPRDDTISGTKLRQSLRTNDVETFKKIAPKEIHDMFSTLQEYI